MQKIHNKNLYCSIKVKIKIESQINALKLKSTGWMTMKEEAIT